MDIKGLFERDSDIVRILTIVDQLGLSDSWLAAGTLRNFIWNQLSGYPAFDKETDVDVVFFDQTITYEETLEIEKRIRKEHSTYNWELRNQADMHSHSPNTRPYTSSKDAISKYPERCTAIGARLDNDQHIELFLPYGIEDILSFKVRPTPHFQIDQDRMAVYRSRIAQKNWQSKWPQLKIEN
ncbi:Uncharacterized protein conserved in bacteria [Streptococcus criceti]|uniref:Nucleotidyltransferase family protein n=1 Tax=Streptococcus criceti HS-6 TaxID=873449 RepID=G5JMS7_STRCG|nr:nucleotidyltransferase family protein [Streptococcus criceti]EHI73624.1 hypothetical protein STRCR_0041 [Streptococcus criceti HS-6]SUN41557.1 Uncharacterized protein conserved in bacteria [Streptococcus criceti]